MGGNIKITGKFLAKTNFGSLVRKKKISWFSLLPLHLSHLSLVSELFFTKKKTNLYLGFHSLIITGGGLLCPRPRLFFFFLSHFVKYA